MIFILFEITIKKNCKNSWSIQGGYKRKVGKVYHYRDGTYSNEK